MITVVKMLPRGDMGMGRVPTAKLKEPQELLHDIQILRKIKIYPKRGQGNASKSVLEYERKSKEKLLLFGTPLGPWIP